MKTILYANLLPFVALTLFLLLLVRNVLFDRRQNRLFMIAVAINMGMLVMVSLDFLFRGMDWEYVWIFRRVTSFFNFAASPLIPLLLLLLFSGKSFPKVFYIPAVLNALLCGASIFCRLVFLIGHDNSYGRGPLFLMPFCVSVLYMGVLLLQSGQFNQKGRRSERIYLFFVVLLLSACMYLEVGQHYVFLSWDAAAVSIILYYMLLNINNSTSDLLTGAFNRAMYNKVLSDVEGDTACAVAMLDINNFKQVNDQQGHDAGDRVLIAFVRTLQAGLSREAPLYRVGGDEFAVVSRSWDAPRLAGRLEEIREDMNRTTAMDFAFGVEEYLPAGNLDDCLKEIDRAMYRDKARRKERGRPTPLEESAEC